MSATAFSRAISAGALATAAERAGDVAVSRRVVAASAAASTSALGAPGVCPPDESDAMATGRLDFAEPSELGARDACTRALTPVFAEPVRGGLAVAFGPGDDAAEARSVDDPPEADPDPASACATAVPPARAAPIPSETAPAPSH
jgi:hypothetical protein